MKIKTKELIVFFQKKAGIARFSDILKAGFHSDSLNILKKDKKIEKIGRGLYKLTNCEISEHSDIVVASFQSPRGIICLLSALYFYEATIEIPKYVHIALPCGAHAYKINYPPVKFYHFDAKSWNAGIEEREIVGYKVRIYNLAKTIADCFKFRSKVGMDVAREALKIAVTDKNIKPNQIMQYAKICRVDKIIKPILETML